MNSIFSTQNESTIYQRQQARKENNENKKVQFANVAFSNFLKQGDKMLRNEAVSSNLEKLTQNSANQKTSFISHFDTSKMGANAGEIEISDELLDKLKALIKNYSGEKGDLKDSESLLLNLMKEIVGDLEDLGFDTAYFESFYEDYAEQSAKKQQLKDEIIDLANRYVQLDEGKSSEKMLTEIESKLYDYYEALQDSGLRSFFAPLMPYLKDSEQESIIKALYTIDDELKDPQVFELNGGKKLSWKVDEGKILFKVLSDEELARFQAERQESKIFEIMSEAYELNAVNLGFKTSLNISLNRENLAVGFDLTNSTPNLGYPSAKLNLKSTNLGVDNAQNSAASNKISTQDGLLKKLLQMNFGEV